MAERALNWPMLAAAAGISADELDRIVRDERPVAPQEVSALAAVMGASAEEIARRCGVTTRTAAPPDSAVAAVAARLDRIEAKLDALAALLKARG